MLYCISHLSCNVDVGAGRRAFTESGGIRILYASCEDSIDSRELESIVLMASVIMRKSFPKNRLPITSLKSVLSYNLPHSDFHTLDMGEGQGKKVTCKLNTKNNEKIKSPKSTAFNLKRVVYYIRMTHKQIVFNFLKTLNLDSCQIFNLSFIIICIGI